MLKFYQITYTFNRWRKIQEYIIFIIGSINASAFHVISVLRTINIHTENIIAVIC